MISYAFLSRYDRNLKQLKTTKNFNHRCLIHNVTLIIKLVCIEKSNLKQSLDFISFQSIFFQKSIFNLIELSICNESFITMQYRVKCNNPLYRKLTNKYLLFDVLCCRLYGVIAYFLPQDSVCTHLTVMIPHNAKTSAQAFVNCAYPSQYENK